MHRSRVLAVAWLAGAVAVAGTPVRGRAQQGPSVAATTLRDGQHDFDFEIGTWKTRLRVLRQPLTGSTAWSEYEGTTVVRRVLHGRANLVELIADGPSGHFEGTSLRLYDPRSHQWSLNFANADVGTMSIPTIGEFEGDTGTFYDQELLRGRAIFVRFVILPVTRDSIRFEQSYSADGGRTWELNWIATDTRIPG